MNAAAPITPGKVLVVGLGISGMATAIRLRQAGWEPTIVERAPGRRTEGYFIATMGAGQAAARRLGVLDDLPDRTPGPDGANFDVDRDGNSRRSVGIFDIPLDPRPMLQLRGDVEDTLFTALPADVEVRCQTTPTRISQDDDGVDVVLRNTVTGAETTERYELVVGADGLRSTVRSLVFGPHEQYLHPLGYMIAAFQLSRVPAGLGPTDGAMQFEVGRSLIVYPFADHLPTALFSYRTEDIDAEFAGSPVDRIREVYGPAPYGELLEEVIIEFGDAESRLFDSATQVKMDSWHRGRVVLVGDSAWCPTLYSGMGSSSGMAGGQLLGDVLENSSGSLDDALTEWERRMRPYTDAYQQAGLLGAQLFTPGDKKAIAMRRGFMAARRSRLLRPVLALLLKAIPSFRMRNADIAAETAAA
ncbi:FAD-dependent monooxygenase [Mycolicibacterium brumae]|uniref:FAD-dependent oxidoreductase n=1 Tax=Mycolicibacterium brumae TaxID=85968 RepID=A0A2G5PA26_9MYCO|nr:FAD-dependent monooxygenase [Mycolicibacterium brumae]MCV7193969.1 FAD-dependent monooxygenase [Mycolicibacterium brumae]PIB74920.1 FAD-dependent oxidoreductase [Mycolicibacterium brumae]RWA22454.1 hypothetical protein MBRU_12795 [Mycolicibacterium brumae DSM 44177]UWW08018.1 FAD-dependent monooxygenase [Mycolicibacterium brumae]